MILTHTCPCCAQALLRHTRSQGVYWFCAKCHQEMPILKTVVDLSTVSSTKSDRLEQFSSEFAAVEESAYRET
ncbi:MAG TPA: hypothetical protein V6C90_04755 [Coleofasciculaceae cyanobacterium]|jgi:ribosomal protein L37AE/L43A